MSHDLDMAIDMLEHAQIPGEIGAAVSLLLAQYATEHAEILELRSLRHRMVTLLRHPCTGPPTSPACSWCGLPRVHALHLAPGA